MIKRTHLAIGLVVALYFLSHVENKFIFIPVVLFSSLLPDIDSVYSTIGKHKIFRPLQLIFKHRGVFHSYTFCIFVTVLFAFFYPILALPFFLGYSFHLFADSFTHEGIKPFWPLKLESSGNIRVNGTIEHAIFWVFVLLSILLVSFSFL